MRAPPIAQAVLLCALAGGCAHGLRIPGPLHSVGERRPHPTDTVAAPSEIGASTTAPSPREPRHRPRHRDDDDTGARVAAAARHYLNHSLDGHRDDCSGFVNAATARAGRPLTGNTAALWALLDGQGHTSHNKRPLPGDLAFFDNTYDRDHDGRVNDALTHVAIVLSVDDDGNILLAHGGTSRGRTELRMNLVHPSDRADDEGTVINDTLRRRRATDRPHTPHLASELWRGFGRVPDDDAPHND